LGNTSRIIASSISTTLMGRDGSGFYSWSQGEIYKKLKPLALRMDADDYLELPEINDVPIFLSYPLMRAKDL
jgi:hypothetical protein